MKRIDLKVGFLCNNNCVFCVQAHKKKFGNKDKKELLKSIKDSAKKYKGIVFTGGEPTIRKDIFELVSFAKKCGYSSIQIQTNGRMFAYLDFCRKMIKAGANEFAPALHGHIPQLHDHLTASPGSFAQTVAGIKNLKKLEQTVMTNTVIVKSNYRNLAEIAKLLVKIGVDQMQFAFVHAIGNAAVNFDSVVPRKTLAAPYVKKAVDVAVLSGKRAMIEAMPFCFLKKYEKYASENIIPETKMFDLNRVVDNYGKERKTEGKKKGPRCRSCKYFKQCEGPWKEYPEHFGWSEFIPVKNK